MYACGLRISEATTLGAGAVDRANQVLRIIGKSLPRPSPIGAKNPRGIFW